MVHAQTQRCQDVQRRVQASDVAGEACGGVMIAAGRPTACPYFITENITAADRRGRSAPSSTDPAPQVPEGMTRQQSQLS
jgi:hypothetical protein